jgi:hypothetical protein
MGLEETPLKARRTKVKYMALLYRRTTPLLLLIPLEMDLR